jgi:Uma2 family endonuclease
MTATGIRMTADELFRLPDNGMRRELIAGELHEMPPAGGEHGGISGRTVRRLSTYLDQHPEVGGDVFIAEPGYRLARNPDTVRAPDVAYVIESRLDEAWASGYSDMAPDLVVEVVSPNDTATEIQRKVDEWLSAGSQLVWVLYPATHSAMVFRQDGSTGLLHAEDTLTGDPVLPGFVCQVSELFERGRRPQS